MKSPLLRAGALLFTFVLGLAMVHPVALAMENLTVAVCSSAKACVAGTNHGSGPGVFGISSSGSGVRGVTLNRSATSQVSRDGVLALDRSTDGGGLNDGLFASSMSGTGVVGESENGIAIIGAVQTGAAGVFGFSNSTLASSAALVAQATRGAEPFEAIGAGTSSVSIDSTANITTTGQLYTAGACSAGCSVSRVRSYGTTAAAPTLEDTGESQTIAGTSFVRLDPAFANAIDPVQGYLVLVTPEGETHGLYVATRTPAGFLVRETMSGRTNVPFAYRIVAHPFGVREARLPFVSPLRERLPQGVRSVVSRLSALPSQARP
jgi:hypothetical protein